MTRSSRYICWILGTLIVAYFGAALLCPRVGRTKYLPLKAALERRPSSIQGLNLMFQDLTAVPPEVREFKNLE